MLQVVVRGGEQWQSARHVLLARLRQVEARRLRKEAVHVRQQNGALLLRVAVVSSALLLLVHGRQEPHERDVVQAVVGAAAGAHTLCVGREARAERRR